MIETIRLVFDWPGLEKQIINMIKHCHRCQMNKKASKKKYGHVSPKAAEVTRWNCINVDLLGPKTVKNVNVFKTPQIK